MAIASGNFTSASTWAVCASTAELDSEAGSTAIATTNLDSAAFTPGAITIDGIIFKVITFSGIVAGRTITIILRNTTTSTDVASVVIDSTNITDIGWYCAKLAAPVTLVAGNTYVIRVTKNNATLSVFLYTNGTANNWVRQLRTTTTQAPAAGDKMIICSEVTASGITPFSVTMDNTTSTVFGSPTFPYSLYISTGCTLSYGTAGSTNYQLKIAGLTMVGAGATLNIGTSGTSIPATSTASFLFEPTANVDSGLVVNGTFNTYGNPLTEFWALLNVDAAVAATNLTLDRPTGWKSGDLVHFAPTNRLLTEDERRTLAADASGTSISITAGLTYTHSGSNTGGYDTRGEVVNLTRNIKIGGKSAALQGFILCGSAATQVPMFTCRYTEFFWLGSSTTNKRGINVAANSSSLVFDLQYCVLRDFLSASSAGIITVANVPNMTISNNIFAVIANYHLLISATTSIPMIENNIFIRSNESNIMINFSDVGGTIRNNRASGAGNSGMLLQEAASLGIFENNIAHSNGAHGIQMISVQYSVVNSCRTWRNANSGMAVQSTGGEIIINDLDCFGNTSNGIYMASVSGGKQTIKNSKIDKGPGGLNQATALLFQLGVAGVYLDNVDFTGRSGPSTVADIQSGASYSSVVARNTLFGYANPVNNITTSVVGTTLISQKHNQIANEVRIFKRGGIIQNDTSIFNSGSPSFRIIPNGFEDIDTEPIYAAVNNGKALTVFLRVRESVAGDGTAFAGSHPTLWVRNNPAVGVVQDTLIGQATSAAVGNWETISGTTPVSTNDGFMNFFLRVSGTAGWVNIDDFEVADYMGGTGGFGRTLEASILYSPALPGVSY